MSTREKGNLSRKNHYFSYFHDFWQAGVDLLFPPCCHICKKDSGAFPMPSLCQQCWALIFDPLRPGAEIWVGGRYEGQLKKLVGKAKFQGDALAIASMGFLLEETFHQASFFPLPDLLLSIPGSPERIRKRGINLPHALTRHLSRRLHIPTQNSLLKRVKETPTQQGLSESARRKNVRGCFAASESVRGKHLLLIDDVMTTGSTLEEAKKTLKAHEPASIRCLIAAKTL